MKRKKLKVKSKNVYPLNQCRLYRVTSRKKLCDILGISKEELKLLSDISKNKNYYNCYTSPKGRLIQEPLSLMYRVHNRIANLLSRIETPEYIHYSKKGRSHLTNAKVHLGSKQLMTFDIKSYYPSISSEAIRVFFRDKLKCELDIAYILSKLCSIEGSLPTGSQISVYLCNLVNLDMFNEMNSLCQRFEHDFSVYADDITISGHSVNDSHLNLFRKILERYGYVVKESKTKRYTSNQTPIVTGVALNNDLDVKNSYFKDLRKFCEDINYHIDLEPYAKLRDEYFSLNGKVQYLKQLNRNIPSFVIQTQTKLKKKLGDPL